MTESVNKKCGTFNVRIALKMPRRMMLPGIPSTTLPLKTWHEEFCAKVDELKLVTDAEREYIVDTWNKLPQLANGHAPVDVEQLNSVIEGSVQTLIENTGIFNTKQMFGPYSALIESVPNWQAKLTVRRLWLVIDLISNEYTQLPRIIQMMRTEFPNFDYSSKTTYGWSLFDTRTFAALICKDKIDDSKYSENDKVALRQMIEQPGFRQTPVSGNDIFYEKVMRDGKPMTRRLWDTYELSIQFRHDVKYYEQVYTTLALFRSWDAIITALINKIISISQENNVMIECFHYFIDQFSYAVFETFKWHIPDSPKLKFTTPLMAGFLGSLIPQSEIGIGDWTKRTSSEVDAARFESGSLWEFMGTKKKHFKFREIDIIDAEERRKFTTSRVDNRLARAIDGYKDPDIFLGYLIYYMRGVGIIDQDPNEDGSKQSLLDGVEYLRKNGLNLSNYDISIVWTIDAILDVLNIDDKMKDDELKDAEVVIKDNEKNAAMIRRDQSRSRQLFGLFNSYDPEKIKMFEEMSIEFIRLEEQFNFVKRSEDNIDRLKYDRKNKEDNELLYITDRRFTSSQDAARYSRVEDELNSLEEAMEKNSPWLWEKRELARRRRDFDKQWRYIKLLCNRDSVPWLFVNDMTGLVQDPSSGNTYGRPGSNEEKSEIERRRLGIPSMYWYAQPPIREMEQFDERRFHGGDGFMIPPAPDQPILDSEYKQWAADKLAYDNVRRKFTPYQIAKMFALQEPPNKVVQSDAVVTFTGMQSDNDAVVDDVDDDEFEDDDVQMEGGEEGEEEEGEDASAKSKPQYKEFDPRPESTIEELQLYIDEWWNANARLLNIGVDSSGNTSLPKKVKIKKSAGSGSSMQFRFRLVMHLLTDMALSDAERAALEDELGLRSERLAKFKRLQRMVQPHLKDLQEGRLVDPSIYNAYVTFQRLMGEKWNDVRNKQDQTLYMQEALIGHYDPNFLEEKEEFLPYMECFDVDENKARIDYDLEFDESQTDPYKTATRNRARDRDHALWEAYWKTYGQHPERLGSLTFDEYKRSRRGYNDFSSYLSELSGRLGSTKIEA